MTNLSGVLMSGADTLYVPFAKVDEKQRLVFGYASTETRDHQGEIVRKDAMEAALPNYMKFGNIREMHQPSAVGVAKEAKMDSTGLWLGAYVVDDRAWAKVMAGVYKGFSIGGRVMDRDPLDKSIITSLELTEISLVDRPANPDATYTIVKRVDGKLKPQPIQKWDCGEAAHIHERKDDASECMEKRAPASEEELVKRDKTDKDHADWFSGFFFRAFGIRPEDLAQKKQDPVVVVPLAPEPVAKRGEPPNPQGQLAETHRGHVAMLEKNAAKEDANVAKNQLKAERAVANKDTRAQAIHEYLAAASAQLAKSHRDAAEKHRQLAAAYEAASTQSK